jgi:hypothetical protein
MSSSLQGSSSIRTIWLNLLGATYLAGSAFANGQVNVTTYHNDVSRTGQNTQETTLAPANVNVNQFGKLFTDTVDGYVYAQPLYMAAVNIAGGTHNVLYVATAHDSLYAIDADTGSVYWTVNFIPAGGRTVSGTVDIASGCTDILPELGIIGTPVIDPSTNTIYLVSRAVAGGHASQTLHAIDIGSGLEKFGGPVNVTAAVPGSTYDAKGGVVTFNETFENQRAALLLENGHVIIAWASMCDDDPWHGWLMSYGAATLAQEAVFNTTPNGQEGGIWMGGGGVSTDASGNLYFATGNGTWDGVTNYGDSIMKLGPPANGTFPVLDYFTPWNQAQFIVGDEDVASSSPVLLPALPSGLQLLAHMGKFGSIYVLNANNMGKYCVTSATPCTNSDPQIFEEVPGATVGVWGTPAYWNGLLYWGGQNQRMKAFSFNTTTGAVSTSSSSVTTQSFSYPAPTPSISANGTTNAIMWALDSSGYFATCSNGLNCQVLYAFDATNIGSQLYSSNQAPNYRDVPGSAVKFATPTIANGKVYVGSQYAVSAFGELPTGVPTAAAPILTPAAGDFLATQSVTLTDTTPGATIYYTTNGSTPTTNSTPYTGPITVSATTTIRALAVAPGEVNSSIAGGTYVVNASPTAPQPVNMSQAFNTSSVYAISNPGTTTTNGGLDKSGDALASSLLGTTLNWGGATYVFGFPGQPNGASAATVVVPTGSYSSVSLIATTVLGNAKNQVFTLNFGDGTSMNVTQSMSDWSTPQNYAGESIVLTMPYRIVPSGQTQNKTFYLYGYTLPVPANETLQSITMPLTRNVIVLAVDVVPTGGTVTPTAANPTFSPPQGLYAVPQTVTLSDSTPGATIYYTLDGSQPSMASPQYTAPIPIGSTTTINAYANAPGYSNSILSYATYTISNATPTATAPSFAPAAGSYALAQSVTLSSTTAGASIYYTLDGTTPTIASALYASPIPISATTTVNAITVASGYLTSAVTSGTFTITGPATSTPTLSPAPGVFTTAQTVTLADATAGATIYYTLDGSTPSTSSVQYSGPITVGATTTINAIAVAAGDTPSTVASGTYTISAVPVSVSLSGVAKLYGLALAGSIIPNPGGIDGHGEAYSAALLGTSVALPGGSFTLAGPGPGSAITGGTVALPAGSYTSIDLLGSGVNGNQVNQSFVVTYTDQSTSTVTQSLSDWFSPQNYPGETIAASTAYRVKSTGVTQTGPFNVYSYAIPVNSAKTVQSITLPANANVVFLAIDVTPALSVTPVAASPAFSPAPGTYTSTQTVSLTSATAGAAIYYTLDGSTPTTASTPYTAPISVAATTTINAIAAATGYTTSAASKGLYTITAPPVAASPAFTPAPGNYTSTQTVSLTSATAGAAIYYTLDGSTPTTASTLFTAPISVAATTTINAIAAAAGYTTSGVSTGSYTITAPSAAASPAFSPAPGTYTSTQSVSLTSATAGAAIYYTTNGSTPTTASTLYTAPISVAATTTISAIAAATGYTTSAVSTGTFTISTATSSTPVSVSLAGVANLYGLGTSGTPVTGGGLDGHGAAYPASVLGPTVAFAGGAYTLSAAGPGSAVTGGTVNLPVGTYTNISLLGTGVNGGGLNQTLVVTYTDQSTTTFTQSFSDWATPKNYAGETLATSVPYRVKSTGVTQTGTYRLYSYSFALNSAKSVQSVSLPGNANVVFLAIDLTPTPIATAPTFTPAPGGYTSAQAVTLTSTTAGAAIYYTTNGTTPTTASTLYTGQIAVAATTSITAIAVAAGYTNSAVSAGTYTITLPAAATPTFGLAPGSYVGSQSVTLASATPGATIYYTTNGATPTTASTLYTGAIAVAATTSINAIAVAAGYTNSAVATGTYTISAPPVAATPTFSPAPGPYTSAQSVALASATPGAAIYYTTNGATPTTASTLYAGAIPVAATTTINAIAVANGYTTSAVATGAYTITIATGPVSVSLAGVGNLYGLGTSGTAIPSTGGLDGHGNAYAASLLGATVPWSGGSYTLAAAGAGSGVGNKTVPLPAGNFHSLDLLGSGLNGGATNQTIVVTYTDLSTSTFTQSFSDWYTSRSYPGETIAATTAYRVKSSGITQTGPVYAYSYVFALNPAKTVQSVTLPASANVAFIGVDLSP